HALPHHDGLLRGRPRRRDVPFGFLPGGPLARARPARGLPGERAAAAPGPLPGRARTPATVVLTHSSRVLSVLTARPDLATIPGESFHSSTCGELGMATLGRMAPLALAGALVAGCLWLTRPSDGPMVGKQAPEITGSDAEGKEFALSDYRGKVVLLEFWWGG